MNHITLKVKTGKSTIRNFKVNIVVFTLHFFLHVKCVESYNSYNTVIHRVLLNMLNDEFYYDFINVHAELTLG